MSEPPPPEPTGLKGGSREQANARADRLAALLAALSDELDGLVTALDQPRNVWTVEDHTAALGAAERSPCSTQARRTGVASCL